MERAIQIVAAVNFLVIGLSHTFQPRAWAEFFIWLRGKGHAGVFATAFLALGIGSLIVGFHNVWTGLPVVLTLFGWAQVVKATLYFVFPAVGMRALERVSVERARMFIAPGVVLVALGALLLVILLT